MKICDEIIGMIERFKYISNHVSNKSNLFVDLGFDSLAFIKFLVEIERTYLITFDIEEMGSCIEVDRLIAIVESKVRERDSHD